MNDIQFAVNNSGIKLYADDTVSYQSGLNCEEGRVTLQSSVNESGAMSMHLLSTRPKLK